MKSSYTLRGTERIAVDPAELAPLKAVAEDLPVDVLYEDDDVIVVNKQSGVVVHAGAGNHEGTLVNRLVHRFGKLSELGGDLRPGIVHRLDRYTSGVLLVARTDAAHRALAEQFASREVEKIYLTIVHGRTALATGIIRTPISRHPIHRTRMTTTQSQGRSAVTQYEVIQRFPHFTYLRVKIGTGRTHQIRVHLSSIGYPVVGDRLYGAPARIESVLMPDHYLLHAHRIGFNSPSTGKRIDVEAPIPPELESWIAGLI